MRTSKFVRIDKNILLEYIYDDGNLISEPYSIVYNTNTSVNSFLSSLSETKNYIYQKTVIEDNKKETSDDVCHSHDTCDANMVMLDAFNDVGIDLENDYVEFPGEGLVDTKSDSAILINIWNKAWGEAKKNDFYTK